MRAIHEALQDCLLRQQVGGRVSVALSGGIDSMVVLDACVAYTKHQAERASSGKSASNSLPGLVFDALHVHHGLSPNADVWADFCQQQCEKRQVPLAVVRVNIDRAATGGQGIEGVARAARYAAFGRHGAPTILLAHHANDQAETVLHQLLRGTGLAGLAAMGEARRLSSGQRILRPLLHTSRADIEAYAAEYGVAWISDESNDDTTVTRNFIRHELMPPIERRFPTARMSLARAARHAAESHQMLEALAKIDLAWDGQSAFAGVLDNLSVVRQTNALYHWLRWQQTRPPSQAQLEAWAAQIFRPSPTDKPHQAGGHGVLIQRRAGVLTLVTGAGQSGSRVGDSGQ